MLIFDGDCGFCTTTAMWFDRRANDDLDVVPWQSLDLDDYGLTIDEVTTAVYWVDPDSGRTRRGHLAAGAALEHLGLPWSPLGWIIQRRPVSWAADIGYRLIAKNRYRLPGSTDACKLPSAD